MHYFLGILLGIFPVLRDGLWGFVNEKGEKVLDTKYDYISNPNKGGFYVVANKLNYGLVDSTGREVLPIEFTSINFIYDSLIVTQKGDVKFLLDASYKKIVQEPIISLKNISPDRIYYDDTSDYKNVRNIYAFETQSHKIGFFCKSKLLKAEYDSYTFLKNKYLQIRKDGKLFIADLRLNAVNQSYFDDIKDLGAYYVYKQKGHYGLLKANFTQLLQPIYSEINSRSFHDKMYILYKTDVKNSTAIYDLESERELMKLPFSDVTEIENGDLVDAYKGFPKYVQVFNAAGKTGVYDLERKQIIVSITHNSLAYINKDRFISYDNYSKFQVIYNNQPISKDTILGFVQPFDSLPVTSFYKDIMHKGKIVRFYGAFNLNGEVLVPYPVTSLHLLPNKITFSSKMGTKSVVKYDKSGKFEEYIDNYTSIVIHDTTEKERPKKYYNPCVNNRMDYTSKFQFLYSSVDLMVNKERVSTSMKRIYSKEKNDCAFGGLQMADANLDNLSTLGVSPIYTRDFSFKIADARKNKVIETLSVDVGGKPMKKKFAFATSFAEGLSAIDFSPPDGDLLNRHKKNERYFGGFYNPYNFYSDGYAPKNFMYHSGIWGFIDTTGKVVIQPRFSKVELFNHGVAIVQEGQKYAVINRQGENVAKKLFSRVDRIDPDTLFIVQDQFNGMGYLDKKFKTLLVAENRAKTDAPGNSIYPIVCKNKKWAYRHFDGRWITDSIYSAAKPFVDGYAPAQDNLWSFIDTTGKAVSLFMYAEVKNMQCGRAFVKLPNKDQYFIIDKSGQKIGKMQFDDAHPYEQDLAIVSKDGHWGVIDLNGEWVYKNEFTSIAPFNIQGDAKAVKGGETYIISSEKNIRKFDKNEMTYEKNSKKLDQAEIAEFNEMINNKLKGITLYADKRLFYKNSIEDTPYLPFVQPAKCGLMTRKGVMKLEVEYQHISPYLGDLFKVYKNNDIGYYSLSKGWVYKPW